VFFDVKEKMLYVYERCFMFMLYVYEANDTVYVSVIKV